MRLPIDVIWGDAEPSLVLVDSEGYVSEHGAQLPINQAGFSIHSAIHRARPEVNSAAHAHTQYGRAWSVFGKPLEMLNQDSCLLYNNQSVYLDGGKVVRCGCSTTGAVRQLTLGLRGGRGGGNRQESRPEEQDGHSAEPRVDHGRGNGG